MTLFDPRLFDPAVFDTGAVATTTPERWAGTVAIRRAPPPATVAVCRAGVRVVAVAVHPPQLTVTVKR